MIKCTACQSLDFFTVKKLEGNSLKKFKAYSEEYYQGYLELMVKNMEVLLLRCNNCKHFFYSEIPNEKDISSMYKIHADRYNKKSKTKLIPQLKYKHKILQSIARTFPDAKTFLDYGAGNCFWSEIASEYFEVTAFDEYISRMIQSTNYSIENNFHNLLQKKFDIIFCNQVLEHMIDPNDAMKKFLDLSHSNTLIYLSVPNTQRAKYKKFVNDWPYDGKSSHLMAPFQHLQGFSQKSLRL